MAEIKFTDDNYKDFLEQEKLVVIDVWATFCGPCQRLTPIIAQVAEEYEGKAIVGKYNAENNEELTELFDVRNIPTILFLKNGQVLDRISGVVTAAKIKQTIDKWL